MLSPLHKSFYYCSMAQVQISIAGFIHRCIEDGDIDAIESLYTGLQEKFESDPSHEDFFNAVSDYPSETVAGMSIAQDWLDKYPRSYVAHILLSQCILAAGYARRGSGTADLVSAHGWEALNEAFDTANNLLQDALKLHKQPFFAWLYIGRLYGFDPRFGSDERVLISAGEQGIAKPTAPEINDGQMPRWYREAARISPASYVLRVVMMDALRIRWGGSAQAMETFAYMQHPGLTADQLAQLKAFYHINHADYIWRWEGTKEGRKVWIEEHFLHAYTLSPRRAAHYLGEFYWHQGHPELAEKYMLEDIRHWPESGDSYLSYGEFLSTIPDRRHEAREQYEKAAALEHIPAWIRLGSGFREGIDGCPLDFDKAISWYTKAYMAGNLEAGEYMASMYWEEGDTDTSIAMWRKLAEEGLPFACARMADMHLHGDMVEYDFDQAVAYVTRGIYLGSPQCYYLLGSRLHEGVFMLDDDNTLIPGNGEATDKEKSSGIWYLHKSADLGYLKAMRDLAYCYYTGDGVEEDKAEGANWYCLVADRDPEDTLNCCWDAFIEVAEEQNIPHNADAAARYLHQGASQDGSQCQVRLAYELMEGGFAYDEKNNLHVHDGPADQRNTAIAVTLYERAAAAGSLNGIHNLGAYYDADDRDLQKAMAYFMQAAEAGYAYAQTQVGRYYLQGRAVPKDKKQARYWLELAIENGDDAAKPLLKKARSIW
ncbi:hypothetical protein CK934_18150 [Chitinophaga sp. MD30]|nr:hypothetical protein CK934_18150 [Chitinophaga sp. MD30]